MQTLNESDIAGVGRAEEDGGTLRSTSTAEKSQQLQESVEEDGHL